MPPAPSPNPDPNPDPDPDPDPDPERERVLARAPVPAHRTLPYGPHPEQCVDFWLPRRDAYRDAWRDELVLLLHGGDWRQAYDRRYLSPLAADLAARGYLVGSAEYRRTGGVGGWPATFDDAAAVVDAAPGLAESVSPGLRLARTTLVGHSAGGHLALWAASRHRLPRESRWCRDTPPAVRVLALGAIADLRHAARLRVSDDAAVELLGVGDRLAARLPEADPTALLPAGLSATLLHGRADREIPVELSERYVRAARAAGDQVTLHTPETVGHFAPVDPDSTLLADALAGR